MECGINLKCGTCENIINRTNMVDNMTFDDENVKNCFKKKMFEYFGNYCMNCASKISKGMKTKNIRCKCHQLKKLLDADKFEHYICEACLKKTISTCKICGLYHQRLAK